MNRCIMNRRNLFEMRRQFKKKNKTGFVVKICFLYTKMQNDVWNTTNPQLELKILTAFGIKKSRHNLFSPLSVC